MGARHADRTATVGFGLTATSGAPVGPDSSFQIGSVTKVLTALLLCDAVVRREVDLDQPLDTLVPSAANHPGGPPITLGDLAMHTAGLPRLPPGLRRRAWRNRLDPYADFTAEDLLDAMQRPPRHPAGGRPRYSNLGAGVLGHALARGLGADYGRLVVDRVAAPLGMDRTGIDPPRDGRNVATGHDRRGRPVPDWHLPALAGAGALRSTADDLLLLLSAHLDPTSSPLAEAIELCVEPRRRIRGALRIALGWHVLDRRHGPPVWWHNGGTGGFSSFAGFVPDTRAAVAVLANSARSVDRLGMNLLSEIERTL